MHLLVNIYICISYGNLNNLSTDNKKKLTLRGTHGIRSYAGGGRGGRNALGVQGGRVLGRGGFSLLPLY